MYSSQIVWVASTKYFENDDTDETSYKPDETE